MFVNSSLVNWLSKRQSTVKTLVFGVEFVTMKTGIEDMRALRYKLRMMGVHISGLAYVYCDNKSVVTNTQKPESTLRKKSNQICYHFVRESVAARESKTAHISTDENPADLATKIHKGGRKRTESFGWKTFI